MVFKGYPRCSGDMWVGEDIGTRLAELVCLPCGRRLAGQAVVVGLNTEQHISAARWLMPQTPPRMAAYAA